MALLGVVLLLIGAGLGITAYVAARSTTETLAVTAFGFSRNATALELVVYGAVTLLLLALGWALLSASARRRTRQRREEREAARITEVEERAETDRLDFERRFEEAGLHDDDLRRREDELAARHEGLNRREAELERREAEWREREGPSVADVVTGRAEGSVSQGTAHWADDSTDWPVGTVRPEHGEQGEYGGADTAPEAPRDGAPDTRYDAPNDNPNDTGSGLPPGERRTRA